MFCFPRSDHVMFSREFAFCLPLIMHAHACGCKCIRRHFKETVLWGTITWSDREKNIQTKKVYWKNGSVKSCWVIKVHYGLGENGE